MKKFVSEFKEFAMKGNVVDMAVGIIIGAAFGKIVTSLVNDIIMPLQMGNSKSRDGRSGGDQTGSYHELGRMGADCS